MVQSVNVSCICCSNLNRHKSVVSGAFVIMLSGPDATQDVKSGCSQMGVIIYSIAGRTVFFIKQ